MKDSVLFDSIKASNDFNNQPTLHPLVSVTDFSKAKPRHGHKMTFEIYAVLLKEVQCGDLMYGKNTYDYQEGSLMFIGPGQTVDVRDKTEAYQPHGVGLFFHPDLLIGTRLSKMIDDFGFFSYNLSEALHLSESEEKTIKDVLAKIDSELRLPIDKHSRKLITSNIALLLEYCERYYDRQFITREHINSSILKKFEDELTGYLNSEKPYSQGLPSVGYFASKFNLSPNYFGDLIRKETGKSAQELIQDKLIKIAKDKIFDTTKSVKEIAFELGFKYPQHFSRVFKKSVGVSPLEFRDSN